MTFASGNLIASSVGPGLTASGLIGLAGLFRTNLDLSTEGSVELALEVNDALVVALTLLQDGRALELGNILGLGSRGGSFSQATLGGPGANIVVAKRSTAVTIKIESETRQTE